MFSNQIYDTWFSCNSWNCCNEKYTVILFYLKVYTVIVNQKQTVILVGLSIVVMASRPQLMHVQHRLIVGLQQLTIRGTSLLLRQIRITIKSLFDDVLHCYDNELEDERSIVGINWIDFSDKFLFKYHVTDMIVSVEWKFRLPLTTNYASTQMGRAL